MPAEPLPIPTPHLSYQDFQALTLCVYGTGRHARKTMLRIRQVLRELGALDPPPATPADLTTDLMARWVALRGPQCNPNTLNGLLGAAAAICSLAVAEGLLDRPPIWRRLRLRPRTMTANAPPAHDALARLLTELRANRGRSWFDHRLCAAVWLIALTGLRRDEALFAWIVDLDLDPARPTLAVVPRARRLKTAASAARVPLPDALVVVLREWVIVAGPVWLFPGIKRRGPWTGGSPGHRPIDALKRAALAAGIPRITWHVLRHAFATTALERWGLPVWIVQRVLRHTDPRTTARYLHLDDSPEIARAMRGVAYVPPESPPDTAA